MTTLKTGDEKVSTICKLLRQETLEPAKREAAEIIDQAKAEAARIVKEAEAQSEQIIARGHEKIEQERSVLQSALEQAGRQSLEVLRQDIEKHLFNEELSGLVAGGTSEPKVIAKLVDAIVNALDKQGMAADLEVLVPKSVAAKDVLAELSDAIVKRLKDRPLAVGQFFGGAQVKLVDKKMTIDISDAALRELLTGYVRKDFRLKIFGE